MIFNRGYQIYRMAGCRGLMVRALSLESESVGSNPNHGKVVVSIGFFLLLSSLPTLPLSHDACWHVLWRVLQLVMGKAKRE